MLLLVCSFQLMCTAKSCVQGDTLFAQTPDASGKGSLLKRSMCVVHCPCVSPKEREAHIEVVCYLPKNNSNSLVKGGVQCTDMCTLQKKEEITQIEIESTKTILEITQKIQLTCRKWNKDQCREQICSRKQHNEQNTKLATGQKGCQWVWSAGRLYKGLCAHIPVLEKEKTKSNQIQWWSMLSAEMQKAENLEDQHVLF